jgi:hypothetical protein
MYRLFLLELYDRLTYSRLLRIAKRLGRNQSFGNIPYTCTL